MIDRKVHFDIIQQVKIQRDEPNSKGVSKVDITEMVKIAIKESEQGKIHFTGWKEGNVIRYKLHWGILESIITSKREIKIKYKENILDNVYHFIRIAGAGTLSVKDPAIYRFTKPLDKPEKSRILCLNNKIICEVNLDQCLGNLFLGINCKLLEPTLIENRREEEN